MIYLKAVQKITPMDVSVSGTIDEKTYLKNLGGRFSPLTPPGSAYELPLIDICNKLLFAIAQAKNFHDALTYLPIFSFKFCEFVVLYIILLEGVRKLSPFCEMTPR